MPRPSLPLAAACLFAGVPGAVAASGERPERVQPAQLFIQQRIVVKVQRAAPPPAAPKAVRSLKWSEKKGPRCLPLEGLAGALISQPDAVDLVTAGGGRFRAKLDDDCPSLDFYSGFYFKPTRDGLVCAERDALRARSGRACGIDAFKRLIAKR